MLAVIILTYNEELHIARAIHSVLPIASRIIVVDSFSKDRTVEIARANGAEVLQNTFQSQAQQFQWALDNADLNEDWILRLDADEIIETDLARAINTTLPGLGSDVVGINLKRKHIFLGRWVKHGGRYPLVMLRIWRRGFGRVEQRWMDEHIYVWGGRTITLDGGFADWNLNDLTYFTEKHNKYATREAVEVLNQRYGLLARQEQLSAASSSRSVAAKRWVKEKLYNKIPFTAASLGYFLYRYLFQLGFLDGREGLIYHFLQGYWYRFLVGSKVMEFDGAMAPLPDASARLLELERLTGLNLRT
ncbi:glycosyltransferase family 2 protein [Ancylobacter sp. 6x-1]|uniref:Glycosyltransferase family 2 protein n=1 Tax=Ancylobacter crimeensis TaxID=2579147 RepID=A0ABT0D6P4_9HYPH|nr:glycosyltransferase family 2 protein [Ancylobacter crimeensis]MCK0195607.1 glycosyltransferase family 2 protein [Ancylobacter crimeensis]